MLFFSMVGDGRIREREILADLLVCLNEFMSLVEYFMRSTTEGPGGFPAICVTTSRNAAGDIFFGFELRLRVLT